MAQQLWVDKHRPKTLDGLDYHVKLAARMKHLAAEGNVTHMLFYGPDGAGKKTRVMALLRELYGPGIDSTRMDTVEFLNGSGKKLEILALSSTFHIEINPADVGRNDRYAVRTVVQQMGQIRSIGMWAFFKKKTDAAESNGGSKEPQPQKKRKPQFRTLVITQADQLSAEAQQALRRMMEVCVKNCRMILICENTSRIMEAVRSRCLSVRIARPSQQKIVDVLQQVAAKESLEAPTKLLEKIAVHSGRNLRNALLSFETCKHDQYPFEEDQAVKQADWKAFVAQLARSIVVVQSPQCLKNARAMLYQLLTNCIPGETILKQLTKELLKQAPSTGHQTIRDAAHFDGRLQRGTKEVFHLEAFIARFMLNLKKTSQHVDW